MRIIFTVILTLLCFSNTASAEKLKFVQVTDTHLSANGANYQGRDLEASVQILKAAIKSINNTNAIDFVTFSGDNIDVSNEDDLRKFCEITKEVNKPYYITVGDHDISKHQGLNKTQYIEIVKQYNKNQKSSDTYYYFFPNKDFIVIVMDGVMSGFITSSHGSYGEEDLAWLDEVLTKYSNKKAIIIQHFPLVAPYDNKSHTTIEPEAYFTLLNNHKNVIALLSGHYHGGNKVTIQDGVYHISTPALVSSPHQYRVVEIDYDHDSLFQESPKFDLKTEIIPVEGEAVLNQKD